MITAQQLGPSLWRCAMHKGRTYHEAIGSTKWEAERRVKALARMRAKGELGGSKGEKKRK